MAKTYEVAFRINGSLNGSFAEAVRSAQSSMQGLSAAAKAVNASMGASLQKATTDLKNLKNLMGQSQKYAQTAAAIGETKAQIRAQVKLTGDAAQAIRNQRAQLEALKSAYDRLNAATQNAAKAYQTEKAKLDNLKSSQASQAAQINSLLNSNLKALQAKSNEKINGWLKESKAYQNQLKADAKLQANTLKANQKAQEAQIKARLGNELKALQDAAKRQTALQLANLKGNYKEQEAQVKRQLTANLRALQNAAKNQANLQLKGLDKSQKAEIARIKNNLNQKLKAIEAAARVSAKTQLQRLRNGQTEQAVQIKAGLNQQLKALQDAAKAQAKTQLQELKNSHKAKEAQIKQNLAQQLKDERKYLDEIIRLRRGNLKSDQAQHKQNAKAALANLKSEIDLQRAAASAAKAQFDALKSSLKGASTELKSAESALKNLGNNFGASKSKLNELNQTLQRQKQELASLKASLNTAGFSTDHFLQSELRLREAIAATTREIERQRQVAASLTSAQARVNDAQSNFGEAQSVFSSVKNGVETIAAPFVEATKNAMTFEDAMAKVKSLTQMKLLRSGNFEEAEKNMKALTDEAIRLGATTEYTAVQAAEAEAKFGMAGWDTAKILGTVRHTIDLATASKDDFIKVADYISDDMTAMGLQAGKRYQTHGNIDLDASQYMHDAYAYALTQSNLNFDVLHEAMKYSAPIASEWGLSLGEILSTLMGAADSGIKGSMAGTGMRAGLLRLVAPPKAAAAALQQMGMSMSDAMKEYHEAQAELQGMGVKVGDFKTTITNLIGALDKLSPGERLAKINAIFGRNAATFWTKSLSPENAKKFLERLNDLEGGVEGWAADTANVMRDTTVGAFKILESSMDAVSRSVGSALTPAARAAAETFSPLLTQLSYWIEMNPQIVQGIAMIIAAVGGLALAITGAVVAFAGWELLTAQLALFRRGMVATEVASMGLAARMGSAFSGISAAVMGAFASMRAVTWSGLFAGLTAQLAAARVAVTGFFASLSLGSIASSVAAGLSRVVGAIRAVTVASLGFAFSPVGVALMALALAAYVIYQNWSKIAPVFRNVGNAISTALGAAGTAVGNLVNSLGVVGKALLSAFDALGKAGAGETIIRVFLGIVHVLAGVAVSIINIFSSVVNTIAHMFEGLGNAISAALEGEFTEAAQHMKETLSNIKNDWANIKFSKLDFGYDIGANYNKSVAIYKGASAAEKYQSYDSGLTHRSSVAAPTPTAESTAPAETPAPTIDATQAQAGLDTAGQAATQAGTALQNIPQAMEPLINFSTAIEPAQTALQNFPVALEPTQTALQNFPATLEPTQTALQGIVDVAGAARDNIQQLGDKAGGAYASVEQLGTAAGGAYGNVELLGGAAGGAKGQVSGMGLAADAVAGALQTAATRIANIQITAPTISATPVTPAGLYTGGIYDKGAFLTWFAERSPEAAIPLDKSARAVKLWTQAGQMLGVLPSDGATPKIDKPSTESKRGNIFTLQRQVENRVNQIYNSAQKVTETGRIVPYNPLPEEVQERSKIPPTVLTERQRYTSKDVTNEKTLERIRNSRSYQTLMKAQTRTPQNSTSILNKPEQFDIPTDFLKIGGFDLGKIPFIGDIVGKFESWLTKITGMQPVDVYNKFINRKKPQLDATKIFTQTMPRRRGLDNTLQAPPNVMPNLPLSRGKILNPTTTFPSLEPQALTERLSNFEPLASVTPSAATNDYSAASFQPTININVTVQTDGSPSSIRDVGEKIAYSARESFEKMFESFMREKSRRSFA